MNNNLKRKKLLNELFRVYNDDHIKPKPANEVGITFKQIDTLLNVNQPKRNLILSELWNSKEIILFKHNEGNGCFISDLGMESCSNKKYKRKNEDIFLSWLKNFTQIFIPIASLIITIIVLSINPKNNYNKLDTELQTIKQKVEYIEKVQNKKEQNPTSQIHKIE